MKQTFLILLFTLLLIIVSGCRPTKIIRNIEKPENYVSGYKDDFLKIHIKDGSLYVLDAWEIKNSSRLISGTGKYYNYKRDIISSSQKKDHSMDIPGNSILKLRMTQGLWRIDYLALGEIISKETLVTIHPESIIRAGKNDNDALILLNDTTQYLVTYPGDNYFLNYKLPSKNKYEYFLNSKGYYLEWMRDEWLAEQDLQKLRFMFAFPGSFMRKTAKDFKKIESSMEENFWGSRYVQK